MIEIYNNNNNQVMIIIGKFYTNCEIYLGGTKKKEKRKKTGYYPIIRR